MSVMNMGIRLYNKMPTRIKQLVLGIVKEKKLLLLDCPFYSLNEFFLYLKKIIEPISNNTNTTRRK
jgi:hypothetical protein